MRYKDWFITRPTAANVNNQHVAQFTPDFTYNVKSGVLFLYTWNKPSNELEFHRLTPQLCLQGRPSSVAGFAALEIHYFWPPQILQCSKYIISGRRRFCNARNTLFLAVADFAAIEIHYFWPPQILRAPKYTISGRRRFCSARNTLFLAVADLQQPVAVFDGLPHRITLSWPPFP